MPVSLGLWPLPWRVETSLYLVAFAALGLGFLVGEAHARIGRHRLKRDLRHRARTIETLQRDLAAKEAQPAPGQSAGGVIPPRTGAPLRG